MKGSLTTRPASHRSGLTRTVAVLGSLTLAAGLGVPLAATWSGAAASASTLPVCPTTATWPVKPVSAAVRATLVKYYTVRHLNPVTVHKNQMWVLNLKLERAGVHWCTNAGGGRSGYVGVVPKAATAAVLVQVTHKAYPVTGSSTTFATVVKLATGWKVVSDDTAP